MKWLIAIAWSISLLFVGYMAWTVAPSEKIIYETLTTANSWCGFSVGVNERGFVEWGDYKGRTGVVQSLDDQACEYTVKFDENTYAKVRKGNLNKIED